MRLARRPGTAVTATASTSPAATSRAKDGTGATTCGATPSWAVRNRQATRPQISPAGMPTARPSAVTVTDIEDTAARTSAPVKPRTRSTIRSRSRRRTEVSSRCETVSTPSAPSVRPSTRGKPCSCPKLTRSAGVPGPMTTNGPARSSRAARSAIARDVATPGLNLTRMPSGVGAEAAGGRSPRRPPSVSSAPVPSTSVSSSGGKIAVPTIRMVARWWVPMSDTVTVWPI